MTHVYTDIELHGNRILGADLTGLPRESFPPDMPASTSSIIAGDGIEITDNGDGTITITAKPAKLKVEAYRERFTVTLPVLNYPLTVTHGLGSDGVVVSIIEVGTPSKPVSAAVTIIDIDTVEVSLTGEPGGMFDIVVVAGVDPGNVTA